MYGLSLTVSGCGLIQSVILGECICFHSNFAQISHIQTLDLCGFLLSVSDMGENSDYESSESEEQYSSDDNNNNSDDGRRNGDDNVDRKRRYEEDYDEEDEEEKSGKGFRAKRPARGRDIVFRIVVAPNKIGKVIGKQGSKINQLREDTGARIKIADPVTPLEDRVIIISSKGEENEETSAAEQALIQIATVILEESGESAGTAKVGTRHVGPNMMRLLIAGSQAGSLIGSAGKTINEIRNDSGATIKILPQNLLPICASASKTDRLVQVSGEVSQVLKALDHIGVTLREHPPREVISTRPTNYGGPSPANGLMLLPQAALPGYTMQTGNSSYSYLGAAGRAEGGTISGTFALPKVTVEMKIPSSVVGGVIGKRGNNISQVRSLSGAVVKVIGEKDVATRTIYFEGTSQQVATAQNLVNTFINAQVQEQQ